MKKEESKDRIKNPIKALFDDKNQESGKVVFSEKVSINKSNIEESKSSSYSKIFTIFRQVFLYFPGVFVLWVMSAEFAYRFLMDAGENPTITYVILIAAFFFTLFGIGDVRKPKDYLMPISVMAVGSLVAFLAWVTGSPYLKLNNFGILFFPLALVLPFTVKFWLDGVEE